MAKKISQLPTTGTVNSTDELEINQAGVSKRASAGGAWNFGTVTAPVVNAANFAAPSGSSLVGFLQAGAGAVSRTVEQKLSEVEVSFKDFDIVFDDSTDNSTALQAKLADGPGIEFAIPIGIARFATGLTWTDHRVRLYGKSPPIRGNQADAGPCLKYTGSGTGLLLGVNPGGAGTFLEEAQIENLRLKVATNTAIALRLYMLSGGRVRGLFVYGSSGAARTGIKVEGCIDTLLEDCDVQGQEGAAAVPADYLAIGVEMIAGFGGSPTTTITFRNMYLHYCVIGASAFDHSIWEDCIFEALTTGIVVGTNATARLFRPWFEANITTDAYFSSGSQTIIDGAQNFNSLARQTYFDGNAPDLVVLRNNRFTTSHVAPRLFDPAGSSLAGVRLVLDNNILPAGFTIGGNGIDWRNVQIVGMRLATYRFRQTAVAANTSYFPVPQDNGSANAFKMPEKGHILSAYTYYVGATITAGTFDTSVEKNGSVVANLTGSASATSPLAVNSQYYLNTFAAGDTIEANVHTDAAFAATGGEFITEVIVAFGEDGL